MRHTKGPWMQLSGWHITNTSGPHWARTDHCIAEIEADNPCAKDNARLITAAPELLSAAMQAQCSCSVRERESGHVVGCWMPELQAAIAKARGE